MAGFSDRLSLLVGILVARHLDWFSIALASGRLAWEGTRAPKLGESFLAQDLT